MTELTHTSSKRITSTFLPLVSFTYRVTFLPRLLTSGYTILFEYCLQRNTFGKLNETLGKLYITLVCNDVYVNRRRIITTSVNSVGNIIIIKKQSVLAT